MRKKVINPYEDVPSVMEQDPLPIESMLSRSMPNIELEIGFGNGKFVLDRAEANPNIAFVGLETRRKWVGIVSERASKRGLSNVRAWHGDAKIALNRIEPDGCLDRVFIQFPDPWWKERHQKRMVVVPELVEQVARLLKDSGELFVQTDVDFRAEAYQETISVNTDLDPVEGDGRVSSNPFDAQTQREIRCEETGLPIYRMHFARKPRN